MSTTIDQKVVEMRFDNKNFENNVQTSMSTLDKLKKSLNLDGAAKSLDSVSDAAKRFDMSGLGNGVETVRAKFSALEVMAVTTLANITNSAVNAGKRIVSSFTIEPIKTGLQEYETQINAVQTILANTQSKGTNLEQVNSALDELNHYADKTIYNFTEMTRNIGTFTAAGIDLDTSVNAIQGIANLAAVSGSTSQQASTAMYQLSQALATGTVKLMDWNSVVNAGMGGQVFQDALKETSKELGTGAEAAIQANGSFRESLQTGWLTSEVLTETLKKFTTSGANEYVAEYTGLSADAVQAALDSAEAQYGEADAIDKAAEALANKSGKSKDEIAQALNMAKNAEDAATKVKTFTQLMDTLKEAAQSGWTQTWEILIGDFEEAKSLWTDASNFFGDAINNAANARNEMLQAWADNGGRTMAIDAIKNAFAGLMSVIKPIKEAFREVFPPMTAKRLLEITKTIRDFTEKLKLSDKQSEQLKSTFKGLFSIIDIGVEAIKALVSGAVGLLKHLKGMGDGVLGVTSKIGDWISGLRNSVKENNTFGKSMQFILTCIESVMSKLGKLSKALKEKIKMPGFENFLSVMQTIWNVIKKIGSKIVGAISNITKALGNAFRNGDASQVLDIVNSGILATVLLGIKKFISDAGKTISSVTSVVDSATGILDGVKGCLSAWQQDLKANVLLKIAGAIGLLTASIVILSMIDPEKLNTAVGAITMLFANLMGSMAIFDKLGTQSKGAMKTVTLMVGMSIAVLILASALKKIADMDWKELAKGLVGVTSLMAILVASAKILSSDGKKMLKGATQMVIMAAALKILASVCKDLSKLSWQELAKGVSGIGVILLEFVGFQALMKLINPKKMLRSSTSLVIIGTAMEIFANVCKKFGKMDWGALAKSGVAMAGILIIASGFAIISGMASKMTRSSIAMVIIGASMEIFANVCKKFGEINWGSLAKAGVAISGILILASGFALLSGMASKMAKSATALVIIGAGMEIFANVCKKFGAMKWKELAKAGAAISGILILASGFALISTLSNGIISASAALLIMAGSLAIMTPVLKTLGSMSWESIAKGLVAIAGAFAIIGIAGLILKPLVPTIMGLGVAITLFGVGCLAAGVGVAAFATALTVLSTLTATAATAIVASLAIIIVGILELIPTIVDQLTDVLIALCQVIIQGAPALGEAIKVLVLTSLDVLMECVPKISEVLFKLLTVILQDLVKYTPNIVDLIFQFVIEVLDGIAENLPGLIESCVNVIMQFFSGVVEALKGIDTDTLLEGIVGVGLMSGIMMALSAVASLVPGAMVGVLGMGAVIAELALVLAAIGAFAQIPGLEWLINEGGDLLEGIGTAIGKLIGGIVGGVMEGITDSLPQLGTNLSDFMTNLKPFLEGATSIDPSSMDGAKKLAELILLLTAADILDSVTSWLTGGSSMTKFASQLVPFGEAMVSFSSTVAGNIDADAVNAAANAGKVMASMASTIPNSGGVVGFFCGENDMDTFGTQLESFGKSIVKFSNTVSKGKIDADAVTAAANAGKVMASMANTIPNSGGVVGFFCGENNMDTFGTQLESFGKSITKFSKTVSKGKIDADAVNAAANAGKVMASMASTIPNSGGVVGFFCGENDMDTFGTQLESFGKSIVNFSNTVSKGKIDADAVEAAANAGKVMANMANILPEGSGCLDWLIGDDHMDMDDFGEQLVAFGDAMWEFSESISGDNALDTKAITSAAECGQKLADLCSSINIEIDEDAVESFCDNVGPIGDGLVSFGDSVNGINTIDIQNGGTGIQLLCEALSGGRLSSISQIVNVFSKISDLTIFKDNIKLFGSGIKGFSASISGLHEMASEPFVNACRGIAAIKEYTSDMKSVITWISGLSNLDKFSEKMKLFGNAVKGFNSSVSGIDSTHMQDAVGNFKNLADLARDLTSIDFDSIDMESLSSFSESLGTVGTNGVKKFINAFSSSASEASSAIKNFMKNIFSGLTGNVDKFRTIGEDMSGKFTSGAKSGMIYFPKSFMDTVNRTTSSLRNKTNDFYSIGYQIVVGFTNGISENTYLAEAKAWAMAEAAKKAAEEALDIHSPSKIFYGIGAYCGQGMANALNDYSTNVYKASSGMAKSAKDGLGNAIRKVTDAFNGDMDTQPTIRPVIDLSDIKTGANRINGMLNLNPSVGVMANIGAIDSMMNQRIQNGSNSDVVSAIDKLRGDLGNVGGTTNYIDGITYDNGSQISEAVEVLVRAAKMERRI